MLRFQIAAVVIIGLLIVIAAASITTAICSLSSEMRTQQFIERLRENVPPTARDTR